MKENPILTVAIPTYNRPGPLEKILIQLGKERNNEFLILIADDSSTDGVGKVVRKYQKKLKNLRYHKNKYNLGFSGNVCKLYEISQTPYIWFLCDDDTVLPGAIEHIIRAITKYKPAVAVFNCVWRDSYGKIGVAGVDKDIVYTDIVKFNNYNALMRLTYLSIIVVNKITPIDIIKEKAYKDNIFFQLTLALMLLSEKFRFCEVASPIVRRNVGYKYGEFFKFYLIDHLKAVTIIKHKFNNREFIRWSIRHLPVTFQLFLSQKIGLFKYHGKPTRSTILLMIKYYRIYSIIIFTFMLLYYLIPSWVIKGVYKVRLWSMHGFGKGNMIYNNNINRALTDVRETGFITYR